MKILIDARLYGLENAGLGRYVNNLIKNLALLDRENDYTILLRQSYFKDLKLPSNWVKVLADYRHYSFREQLFLPFVIWKHKPDIVHFPHFNIPVFYRGKFVVTIHDMLMHNQKGKDATTLIAPLYLIKRRGYRFVFNMAVKNSDSIIVPSATVKEEIIKEYKVPPLKIHVTYEGVDEAISGTVQFSKPKIPYFIYAGNAYPHKNIKTLIEAILKLNNNYGQYAQLYIASARNIFTQRLEKYISELKAEKYVILQGFVSDARLSELYKNSTGFVFPSLSEGFGLPGLEAIKNGTLLLASNIPVFKEIYSDTALYFEPKNPASIVKKMAEALNMEETKRAQLIKKSQDYIKKYSWKKMTEKTLSIYNQTVKK
jgi:glycosyltransferase involved in cell wall biosynthesis